MKVCWRAAQPPTVDLDLILIALQQTMPSMAKTAGQRPGRQVHYPSGTKPQVSGGTSDLEANLMAPGHAPFALVSAYDELILQRPANTPTANPGQQTPSRGSSTTQGVCCG
jgi:hypothetical protein